MEIFTLLPPSLEHGTQHTGPHRGLNNQMNHSAGPQDSLSKVLLIPREVGPLSHAHLLGPCAFSFPTALCSWGFYAHPMHRGGGVLPRRGSGYRPPPPPPSCKPHNTLLDSTWGHSQPLALTPVPTTRPGFRVRPEGRR